MISWERKERRRNRHYNVLYVVWGETNESKQLFIFYLQLKPLKFKIIILDLIAIDTRCL